MRAWLDSTDLPQDEWTRSRYRQSLLPAGKAMAPGRKLLNFTWVSYKGQKLSAERQDVYVGAAPFAAKASSSEDALEACRARDRVVVTA